MSREVKGGDKGSKFRSLSEANVSRSKVTSARSRRLGRGSLNASTKRSGLLGFVSLDCESLLVAKAWVLQWPVNVCRPPFTSCSRGKGVAPSGPAFLYYFPPLNSRDSTWNFNKFSSSKIKLWGGNVFFLFHSILKSHSSADFIFER